MSANLRALCLTAGLLAGISPAVARDDTPSGDLPCSKLCQYWLNIGKDRVAEAPPAPAMVLAPTPAASEAKPAARSTGPLMGKGRHEHARSSAQAFTVVPLPVPRPDRPEALASARPEWPLVRPSPAPSAVPMATPALQSEPLLRAADPEPILRPSPIAEPIIALASDTAASSAAPVNVPAVLVTPAAAPAAIARPTPLLIKLCVWAALAILAGAFFATGGREARDGAETSSLPIDQHRRRAVRTAFMVRISRQHRHAWDAAT